MENRGDLRLKQGKFGKKNFFAQIRHFSLQIPHFFSLKPNSKEIAVQIEVLRN
jgi:hypothetical protein